MKRTNVLSYRLLNVAPIDILLQAAVIFVSVNVLIQIIFVIMSLSGHDSEAISLSNSFSRFLDNPFKNGAVVSTLQDKSIYVESVTNNVKIGKLVGNRNLEFGVKNILEEFLQEKDYDINPNSPYKLKVDIVYLDVLNIKKNISIMHDDKEEVVVRIKGILYKDGKKVKDYVSEESSSEISMSTLIVDEGGKFNQTSLSNAIKKSCDKLINKLFEN